MSFVWINGELVDKSEAKISVFDHGFLYGDGVWTALRVFNDKVFDPEGCVRGLFVSAETIGITIPLDQSEMIAAIESTVRANARDQGYIRVIVSRGSGTLGYDPRKIEPQVIIIVEEYRPFPLELYEHGLELVTNPIPVDTRNLVDRRCTMSQAHVVQAKTHALTNGCLDALIINHAGEIVGSTEGNVYAMAGRRFCYSAHFQPDGALSMSVGFLLAEHLECEKGDMQPADLFCADEAFLAGTSCGVVAIVQVDGKTIGTGCEGPITKRIREAYRKLTRGEA